MTVMQTRNSRTSLHFVTSASEARMNYSAPRPQSASGSFGIRGKAGKLGWGATRTCKWRQVNLLWGHFWVVKPACISVCVEQHVRRPRAVIGRRKPTTTQKERDGNREGRGFTLCWRLVCSCTQRPPVNFSNEKARADLCATRQQTQRVCVVPACEWSFASRLGRKQRTLK